MRDNIYGPCSLHAEDSCQTNGGTWDAISCLCAYYGGSGGDLGGADGGNEYNYDSGCTEYYWVTYHSWDGGKTWEYAYSSYAGCW